MVRSAYESMEENIDKQKHPHQWIDEQNGGLATDNELKGKKLAYLSFSEVFEGITHIDQIGLHISLDPA